MSAPALAMEISRIAAFSLAGKGGNPAGVALGQRLPPPEEMQRIAAEIGYSETAFAAPEGKGWRVRYFAPEAEVPFCGHATIALGAALALRHGDGAFELSTNAGQVRVEARREGALVAAALHSPPTSSRPAPEPLLVDALRLFSLAPDQLDPRIPPALASAGANHLLIALPTRAALAAMAYDLKPGAILMRSACLATISLVHAESPSLFHARNPFASGGVYEDPATGAAAAALAGYLGDLGWPHGGGIEILQGEDMGVPCRLLAESGEERGGGVRVSGTARIM